MRHFLGVKAVIRRRWLVLEWVSFCRRCVEFISWGWRFWGDGYRFSFLVSVAVLVLWFGHGE